MRCMPTMTRGASTTASRSIGQHHHIGIHLHQYAGEMAWREDNRRKPNGTQFMNVAGAALGHPVSRNWCGYWQRLASAY